VQTVSIACRSFIDGKYCQAADDNQSHPNYHPANNKIINNINYASQGDLEHAVAAAGRAFQHWSRLSVSERGSILMRAAAILREQIAELAEMEVWDTGKPIAEALSVDVLSAADALDYFAKTAAALTDDVIPDTKALIYSTREPLGVCVGIGAWNYPLQIACWKAAPALITGNTMVFKPSELTPMTTLRLAEIFIKAGMPPGVFNVVLGDGIVAQQLLSIPGIAKISFTGSVPTGKKILQQAAQQLLPVTLELGGKSPLIIFSDADIEQAVYGSMLANFYTQGEICSNGTRVFVARDKHDEFIENLVNKVQKLVVGNPFLHETQIGALISRDHMQKVLNYIETGKNEGADLVCGGDKVVTGDLKNGNFIKPAVFSNCHDEMTIVRDEIFGPVMSVLTFDDEDEVIQRANQTQFGLAAGLFTENIKRGHRVARHLQAGICWINNYNVTPVGMPFGGIKHSGFGRENCMTAMQQYMRQKSIYVELNSIEHPY